MNSNREEVLFELALDQAARRVGASKVVQTSVNPKQALMRWTNAPAPHGTDTAAAPTLGRRP